MVYDVDEQIALGDFGEAMFKIESHNVYPFYETKAEKIEWYKKEGDFRYVNGDKVEVKSEFKSSGNCFVETYSSVDYKTLGGVRRAYEEKVKYVVYQQFPKHILKDYKKAISLGRNCTYPGLILVFNTKLLLDFMEYTEDPTVSRKKFVYHPKVPNKGYITSGHTVPINLLLKKTKATEGLLVDVWCPNPTVFWVQTQMRWSGKWR
jgi:hypothetical protein